MNPESLIQLVGSGNTRGVEDQWMTLVEKDHLDFDQLREMAPVLEELKQAGQQEQAAALASTAIESCAAKGSPGDTLQVASPFLLAVGGGDDLRNQVSDLYRAAYADTDGLEELLTEAGLPGGRPVRRALRTLDVCLPLKEGDYLLGRDEPQAARVDRVDQSTWQITITTNSRQETLGAVELADQYHAVDAHNFFVLKQFHGDELRQQLDADPAALVVSLCAAHDGSLTRNELEQILVPACLSAAEWKKWWTRARSAIKANRNVHLERKAPYTITVERSAQTLEDLHFGGLEKSRDAMKRFHAVDSYIKECTVQDVQPAQQPLEDFVQFLAQEARTKTGRKDDNAPFLWTLACRACQLAGGEDLTEEAKVGFAQAASLKKTFDHLYPHDDLHLLACQLLRDARPDTWKRDMLELFPTFPVASLDREAAILLQDDDLSELERLIDKAIQAPLECFYILAWLWNGPASAKVPKRPPITLLSRLLRALDELRRSDDVSKATAKRIVQTGRQVLGARRLERFRECLDTIDGPMANALRTQINRLDNLGRAVRDDMVRKLNDQFPPIDNKPKIRPWQREDVIFVTREGMLKKQEEIDQHVNVKMRENAVAIGRAAEHGDLSENSEYKFALEERDLLRARLAQMNDEMAKAQIMEADSVPLDHVGIGTTALLQKEDSDETLALTFVGPWDVDAGNGRYNYMAPIGQKVLGSRVGDTVELELGGQLARYEIVQLENGLIEQHA